MRRPWLPCAMALAAAATSLTPATADPVGLPPIVGGALASGNVELVASIPDVPAIGGRFIGDILYVTTSQGLRIYDTGAADGIPVPMGALELPHFENEDVDTDGNILLISADHLIGINILYVIDVSNPMLPMLVGTATGQDEGHTISCIPFEGNGCAFAWVAGGRSLPVFDLRDPSNPTEVGSFALPRPANENDPTCNAGGSHDVQLDDTGIAWISSGGGLFGYDISNPVNPALVMQNCANGSKDPVTSFNSNFIIHNSLRPQAGPLDSTEDNVIDPEELLVVTEEDYQSFCIDDGAFQTGWIRSNASGQTVIERTDMFTVGMGTVADGRKPTAGFCSSHYFDHRDDGVMAVAWYEQGIRFLDVSNPRDIRQIGYFLPAVTEAWNAQWKDEGDLVYTFDAARGIDVLRFTGAAGDPTQLAPRMNDPIVRFDSADPEWGMVCRRLLA
jgi:hypothetical protein